MHGSHPCAGVKGLKALQADVRAREAAGGPWNAHDSARGDAGVLPQPPAPGAAQSRELNSLLRQLQTANAENAELRARSDAATERERGLQAIVDGRGAGDQLVPHAVHADVLQQNKVLTAQVQQLRMDLEVLYMEDAWRTNNELDGSAVGASGVMPSAMNTVARLGALIGVSDRSTLLVRCCPRAVHAAVHAACM